MTLTILTTPGRSLLWRSAVTADHLWAIEARLRHLLIGEVRSLSKPAGITRIVQPDRRYSSCTKVVVRHLDLPSVIHHARVSGQPKRLIVLRWRVAGAEKSMQESTVLSLRR